MPNRRGGFSGLLKDPPKPLPDDEPIAPEQTVEAVADLAEQSPPAVSVSPAEAVVAPQPVSPAAAPTRHVKPPAVPAPMNGNGSSQQGKRAATSIRIQQDVADELEPAWLRAKSKDLRLSYSEYASRLLRRALQEEIPGD